MKLNRRDLLKSSFGTMLLKSLATGIPASVLLKPRVGRASADLLADGPGRMLILTTSQSGDPLNANVPGTYGAGAPGAAHSADLSMAPTSLTLGGRTFTAAKPWADLPQSTLDRTVFFHHATYTPVHQDQSNVMRLMGATYESEMLVSIFARELAPRQGSVQATPLSLGARNGSELLTAGGQVLANVGPQSIRAALGGPQGPLAGLHGLRDREIDRLYKLYRDQGTRHDLRLLDSWARSRDEVRSVSAELLQRLDAIDGDDEINQVRAAPILAAMNITPVITIRLGFGGDNHNDNGLTTEAAQTVSGVAALGQLVSEIDGLRAEGVLRHEVIVGTMNVFGRTLKKKGMNGRDHNRGHHVSVLIGSSLSPGVIGGIEPNGNDFVARSINSTTGSAGGDIPFEETLGSMAKTLGLALGISRERMDAAVKLGRPVEAALA